MNPIHRVYFENTKIIGTNTYEIAAKLRLYFEVMESNHEPSASASR